MIPHRALTSSTGSIYHMAQYTTSAPDLNTSWIYQCPHILSRYSFSQQFKFVFVLASCRVATTIEPGHTQSLYLITHKSRIHHLQLVWRLCSTNRRFSVRVCAFSGNDSDGFLDFGRPSHLAQSD